MSGTKVDVMPSGDTVRVTHHILAPDPAGFRYNSYATKRTVAKGLLDISLIMANAFQLKSLTSVGPGTDYYYANMVMIIMSSVLQVITGILLLVLGTMEGKDLEAKKVADKLNNVTLGFVFAFTVINLFVAVFGINFSGQ